MLNRNDIVIPTKVAQYHVAVDCFALRDIALHQGFALKASFTSFAAWPLGDHWINKFRFNAMLTSSDNHFCATQNHASQAEEKSLSGVPAHT